MRVSAQPYTVLAEGRRIDRPHLASDGRHVVWTQQVEGQQDLFLARDGQVERLTDTPENEGFAMVSDRAETIAFTRRDAESNLWQLHLRRGGAEVALEASGHHVQSAALSSDGRQVAWEDYGHISRSDTESALQPGVKPQHGDHDARQRKPQLSADGSTLLYQVSDLDSAESHLVFERDGKTAGEIDNNTDAPTALSSDGNMIVFPTTDEHGFHDLSVLDMRSDQTTVVSAEAGADEAQPSVDDRGNIVFQMTRYDAQSQPVRSLMYRDGAGLRELVPAEPEWEPSLPQLSADGHTLIWLATSKLDPDHQQIRQATLQARFAPA